MFKMGMTWTGYAEIHTPDSNASKCSALFDAVLRSPARISLETADHCASRNKNPGCD
jgi:hypothetical protein